MLYVITLIIHVFSVVIWIGGVAFVTMITFPMIRRSENSLEQVLMFQGVEHRFSKVAKVTIVLAGLSGLLLVREKGFSFGVWLMIGLWAVYASLIFYLERLIFKKLFFRPSGKELDAKKVFFALQVFHWIILTLSFTAIAAGIWTAHY